MNTREKKSCKDDKPNKNIFIGIVGISCKSGYYITFVCFNFFSLKCSLSLISIIQSSCISFCCCCCCGGWHTRDPVWLIVAPEKNLLWWRWWCLWMGKMSFFRTFLSGLLNCEMRKIKYIRIREMATSTNTEHTNTETKLYPSYTWDCLFIE